MKLEIIKRFEGLRLNAYKDSVGIPTIGYGSTYFPGGRRVSMGDRLSSELEAEKLMINVIEKDFLPALRKIPNWGKMNINHQSAILSFAYNLGARFYGSSGFNSITKLIDEPHNWHKSTYVANIFTLYSKAGGRTLKGLVRRRREEARLFVLPTSELGEQIVVESPKEEISRIQITAKGGTVLKKLPIGSSKLEENQKVSVSEGKSYFVDETLEKKGRHTLVRLAFGAGDWWVWKPHWEFS